MNSRTLIVSPHPDDEIIGCWEVLTKSRKTVVFFTETTTREREKEVKQLTKEFSIDFCRFYNSDYDSLVRDLVKDYKKFTIYFPDPYFEKHFAHRLVGSIGERLARMKFDVVFYSVNMEAPYIHEVKNPELKRDCLLRVYPSQSSLFDREKKYELFEGLCKWIF